MKRSLRKSLAHETVEIVAAGFYTAPSGRQVDIRAACETARKATRVYATESLTGCGAVLAERPEAMIKVSGESTFAALARLRALGESGIGCLNFASARNPGGGFLNGAEAQEEALSRASALYDCLLQAPLYYERNRACNSCLYEDLIIASPLVPFFRDDEGVLIEEPIMASVITAPAPNAGAVRRNEPAQVHRIEPVLRARAEMVLHAAVATGIECLVLGAWGCGVFQNDPRVVARAFADHIKPGGLYAMSFKRVTFPLNDPTGTGEKFLAFQRELECQPTSQESIA